MFVKKMGCKIEQNYRFSFIKIGNKSNYTTKYFMKNLF